MDKVNTHDAEFTFCDDLIYSVRLPGDIKKHIFQVVQYDLHTFKPTDVIYGDGTNSDILDIRMCGKYVIIMHLSLLIIKLKVTKTLISDIREIGKNPASKGDIIGTVSDELIVSSYGPVCKVLKYKDTYNIYVYSDDKKQFEFSCASKLAPSFHRAGNVYKYGEAELFTFPICPYIYENNTILYAGDGELKIKADNLENHSFIKYNGKWHIAIAPTDLHKFKSKSAAVANHAIALIALE